ncbi:MAG: Molybdenum cofactor synthesis domain protein [Acetothermia bacterium 64_32]|nr:MAG: Molybdenum cofactor synthesis domain protein [Acetothermia bacterium 64_32]
MEAGEVTGMYPMLSVEEALGRVLSAISPLPEEKVPVLEALGRVTSRDVKATCDVPPHANSAMDGYAVRAQDTAGASPKRPVRLHVAGEVAAGYVPPVQVLPGTAVRIMTGAPLPPGADAVVRFEWTEPAGEDVLVKKAVPKGQDVRPAGEDVRAGELVIPAGTRLRPQELGMLATLGETEVWVHRRPRVGILATGDELVEPGKPLPPGKIRNANSYSNFAQVKRYGGIPVLLGVARDREEEVAARLRAGLQQGLDLLLVSGGVSVGDFDVVKRALAAAGKIDFWRVRMKPGKPLALGRLCLGGRQVPVLGMPGNPVSAVVSFELFARPAILALQGARALSPPVAFATFADRVAEKDDRRHFLRVRLSLEGGELVARLTGGQGSGILSSLVRADALAVIPEDWPCVEPGARVQVILLPP